MVKVVLKCRKYYFHATVLKGLKVQAIDPRINGEIVNTLNSLTCLIFALIKKIRQMIFWRL